MSTLPTEEITLGEVYRSVMAQSETLKEIKDALDKRPTWKDTERLEAARDAGDAVRDLAIKALQDGNTWLARQTAGALIGALGAIAVAVFLR